LKKGAATGWYQNLPGRLIRQENLEDPERECHPKEDQVGKLIFITVKAS